MITRMRKYLTVAILIAVIFLFSATWFCANASFKSTSYDEGHSLGEILYAKECHSGISSQELINLSSIQISKNISSHFSFRDNQPHIQIAELQLEESRSPWLASSDSKSKIPQAQRYILNSSYLL